MTDNGRPLQQHPSLAVAAQDWITNEILAGRIVPGQKLAEEPLADQMGISRSPVREALRALAGQGVIIVEPRRGAFVAEIDANQAADLYACRLLIEPECVRLATASLSDATVAGLEATFERMQSAVQKGQADAYVSELETYNRDLLEACPNRMLFGFAESTWRRSLRYWGLLARHTPTYLGDSLGRNAAIHEAVTKRDGDGAAAAVAQLLSWSRDALAGVITALPTAEASERNPQ
ncbi:GntR family transcriptional regulator [Microbacterium profundi]|uniref:GntR family transcriptional regulator n=1 Tax=Microbacterium profundi TaxID=450380 RepID=UPI001F1A79F6|nr:GntR family transcriptional regulator [Microbacterium profundi]MCE7482006.1 GntR family transcriptional regulator [Microbacterium profundi]